MEDEASGYPVVFPSVARCPSLPEWEGNRSLAGTLGVPPERTTRGIVPKCSFRSRRETLLGGFPSEFLEATAGSPDHPGWDVTENRSTESPTSCPNGRRGLGEREGPVALRHSSVTSMPFPV